MTIYICSTETRARRLAKLFRAKYYKQIVVEIDSSREKISSLINLFNSLFSGEKLESTNVKATKQNSVDRIVLRQNTIFLNLDIGILVDIFELCLIIFSLFYCILLFVFTVDIINLLISTVFHATSFNLSFAILKLAYLTFTCFLVSCVALVFVIAFYLIEKTLWRFLRFSD